MQTNFNAEDYAGEAIPRLSGKTREEVKTTLKSERIKVRTCGRGGGEGGRVGGMEGGKEGCCLPARPSVQASWTGQG